MSDEIKRNESTENGRKIWEAVERAASRAPDWVKQQVKDARQSQGPVPTNSGDKAKKSDSKSQTRKK